MRWIGLGSALLLLTLFLNGCGQSGPKHVPLRQPSKPVAELPTDEVEAVDVEVDLEQDTPAETDEAAAEDNSDPSPTETDTAEASSENTPASTPETPAEPQKPRPSVFLKLLAQPVQEAVQGNLESVTSGAGGLLPSP